MLKVHVMPELKVKPRQVIGEDSTLISGQQIKAEVLKPSVITDELLVIIYQGFSLDCLCWESDRFLSFKSASCCCQHGNLPSSFDLIQWSRNQL